MRRMPVAKVWFGSPFETYADMTWFPALRPTLPANFVPVPLVRQATDYTCGVASTMSVYSYWTGIDVEEDDLALALGTTSTYGTAYRNMSSWLEAQVVGGGGFDRRRRVVQFCSSRRLKRRISPCKSR